tara:strand:+ start:67735 stop:67971 length:237 start_codon:yes stop_codon:yes gene_type:complete
MSIYIDDILDMDNENTKQGVIAMLAIFAQKGNHHALDVMDNVQILATEKWADLTPSMRTKIELAFQLDELERNKRVGE